MIDSTPWANRRHNGRPTVPLELSAEDRARLEALLGPGKVEKRLFLRGQALLLMADGVPACDVAMVLGVNERTVFKWKKRFDTDKPLERLSDAPRPGRPPSLSRRKTAPRS
jgi:hypothetical protein